MRQHDLAALYPTAGAGLPLNANAQGGNDTIQAARLQAGPEPMTMILFGTGLAGIAAQAAAVVLLPG